MSMKPEKTGPSADEEKKLALKDVVCLNWACNKIFKRGKNHKKACKCHPGKWDFGNTPKTVSDGMNGIDPDEQMWPAHWTCCRGTWDSEGCRRTYHRGMYLDEYQKNPRKYTWPDPRVQTYFTKNCSFSWDKKMEE